MAIIAKKVVALKEFGHEHVERGGTFGIRVEEGLELAWETKTERQSGEADSET